MKILISNRNQYVMVTTARSKCAIGREAAQGLLTVPKKALRNVAKFSLKFPTAMSLTQNVAAKMQ